ncbi:MAG: flagellar protein FliS, partial [Betaproteobacteria bacterium]|nr:flagellar protein FliS [Betaproteobacteria bacterium]
MTMRSHRAYAATQRETSVSSARPIDLVVMVYARLIDHLRSAQLQMAEGFDSAESLTKAVDLITKGLNSCLDMEQG